MTSPASAVQDLLNLLDLEPLEKQALLEQHGLRKRAESLVDLLEMKLISARGVRSYTVSH